MLMCGFVLIPIIEDTLPGTNMEVENYLFLEEHGLPFGASSLVHSKRQQIVSGPSPRVPGGRCHRDGDE